MARILSLLAITFLLSSGRMPSRQQPASYTVLVEIESLTNYEGTLRVLVFDKEEGFPSKPEAAIKTMVLEANRANQIFKLEGLPDKRVAITLHHDENGNGELDTDWFGRPTEGWAVSNNVPAATFGPPDFEDALFNPKTTSKLRISLNY